MTTLEHIAQKVKTKRSRPPRMWIFGLGLFLGALCWAVFDNSGSQRIRALYMVGSGSYLVWMFYCIAENDYKRRW